MLGQQVGASVWDDVRRKQVARKEPRARLERERRALRRRLSFLLAVMAALALVGVTAVLGPQVAVFTLIVAACGVVALGVLVVRTTARTHTLTRRLSSTPRTSPRAPEAGYRLPPVGSKARKPLQRLASAEAGLSELLVQLLPTSGVPIVPVDAIVQARATADDAAQQLRRLGAQLRAVEQACETAGTRQRADLVEALHTLRERMDEGLDAYGGLVAAAGRVVATSARQVHREDLMEATDRLAGLAAAFAELSYAP